MPDFITQDELDTLLSSIQVAEKRRRPGTVAATAALYDFRYASKLSPDHMRVLHSRILALASVLNRTMSLYLNNAAEFQIHSIDIASYEQYIRNLAVRPILGVISFGQGMPQALWEMSSSLAAVALDCMLGGTGVGEPDSGGEITSLEKAIINRLFQEILSAWTELWDRLKTLHPRAEGVVSSPSAVDLRINDERLFCVVLEVTIARTRGILRLCLPLSAVKRLLHEEKESISPSDLSRFANKPSGAGALSETPLTLSAYLEAPPLPLATLLNLQVGEVLDLRVPADKPFTVGVGEVAKFEGQAGIASGRMALRITGQLEDQSPD
jgi:flagellar motor switch protein FliM